MYIISVYLCRVTEQLLYTVDLFVIHNIITLCRVWNSFWEWI